MLNKYYPPDYDPAAIPRIRASKQRQIQSRIMLPMSVQCTQCGEFVYKGKKFNARKEVVAGEEYLGIKRWRFYFRCPSCLQEMTFKTDPQHGGYEVEKGARRNVEPWRDRQREQEEAQKAQEAEEQDVMKKLENKSKEGRRDHQLAEVLEELRERNGRGEKLTLDELVEWHVTRKQRQEADDDERLAKEAFNTRIQQQRRGASNTQSAVRNTVTIDALDIELAEDAAESDEANRSEKEAEAHTDERADKEGQEEEHEEQEEEARQWASQRRELTASGLSFGQVNQRGKRDAVSEVDERKEGPTPSAAIVIVKRRRTTEPQSQTGGASSTSCVLVENQREKEASRVSHVTKDNATGAKPAVVALSSLLNGYEDNSDSD